MNKRIITLIRHGKVDGPAALYGHTDITSSIEGLREVQQNIETLHRLNTISHIVCSPLLRCTQPAQTFSLTQQLPVQIIHELKEMNFGRWDGIPFEQFTDEHWQSLNQFWETPAIAHVPGGETLQLFAERIIRSWKIIESNIAAQHQLVICHGGVIRIIIAHLLNLDWRNPGLFRQLHIDYASHTGIEIANHSNAVPIITCIGVKTKTDTKTSYTL